MLTLEEQAGTGNQYVSGPGTVASPSAHLVSPNLSEL